MPRAQFPHCDSRVLHAPTECVYCDHYPEAQQERIDNKINFTGHHDTDKKMCPAESARALDNINRWGGNVAKKGDEDSVEYAIMIQEDSIIDEKTPLVEWVEKQ